MMTTMWLLHFCTLRHCFAPHHLSISITRGREPDIQEGCAMRFGSTLWGVWAGFSLQKEHLWVWTFRALGETFEFPWFYQSYHHPWWTGEFAWFCHIRLRWIAAWAPMPPGRTRKRGWMLRRRHQLGGWIRCVMIWYDMIWCTSNILKRQWQFQEGNDD